MAFIVTGGYLWGLPLRAPSCIIDMKQAIMDAFDIMRLLGSCTVEDICTEVANLFSVQPTEIGLLRAEGEVLRFLYPPELQVAGVIPFSSAAVAARTATTRKSELFNNFPIVPHHTVFELVRLSAQDAVPDSAVPDPPQAQMRIQKFMSAPIVGDGDQLLGVIQVSRKGFSPGSAGPDFTGLELQKLEETAKRIALLRPSLLQDPLNEPPSRLQLQNEQKHTKSKAAKAWNLQ